MGTKKYYVVWEGKKTGVFSSWDTVKKLVQGYEGAKYKSFVSKVEADKAIKKNFSDYNSLNVRNYLKKYKKFKRVKNNFSYNSLENKYFLTGRSSIIKYLIFFLNLL